MRIFRLVVLMAACSLLACAGASSTGTLTAGTPLQSPGTLDKGPEALDDGIDIGSPASVMLDPEKISAGIRHIQRGDYGNIHSLLIFRNGRLVSERYFPGEDRDNHKGAIGLVQHGRDTLHDVRSISKSVVALAVLIAHERGHIASLDQPLMDYFPEHTAARPDDAKAPITIKHALTMTAGLEWNENIPYTDQANDGAQIAQAADPIGFVLARKQSTPPGAAFNYNGGLTQLLAAVVERSTGSDIEAFTRTNLLTPLGIEHWEWAKRRDGKPDADSGLRLRSRDLAKIGLLFANRGLWNGARIVSARLMDDAVAPHIALAQDAASKALEESQAYGYQTWLFTFPADGERVTLVELSGNGGQKVYIDRTRRLMVVTTAGNYDRRDLPKSPIDIYFDIAEAALVDR